MELQALTPASGKPGNPREEVGVGTRGGQAALISGSSTFQLCL